MAGLGLSALALRYLPAPFIWILWGWALGLLAGAWLTGSSTARAVMFNVAVLVVALAVAETWLSRLQHAPPSYSSAYFVPDDVLGTVPIKPNHVRAVESDHGKPIYDVEYDIGANGLRVEPPAKPNASSSVLFFGCSFTFGEGLKDDQTLPYQVGAQSNGNYAIYNFGFHGYGPHQMLAAIESGKVRQTVEIPPRYAIYQALPDHIARLAGKVPYGAHSPRFQLDAGGNAVSTGHFDDGRKPPSAIEVELRGQLRKSAIDRTIESLEPHINENDIRLFVAVVRKSRDELVAQYPGIEFRVLLWRNFKYEQKTYDELRTNFAAMNITVDLVENILPDYNTSPDQYILSPADRHPNALADRLLASYVVSKVLEPEAAQPANHGDKK